MPPYELKATPMQLPDGSMLDLIEWTDPVDSRSPYEHVNHRGINRVALLTTQLDALLEKVDAERGTAFSSAGTSKWPRRRIPLGYFTRRSVARWDPTRTRRVSI